MEERDAAKGGEDEEGEEVDLGSVTVFVDKSNTSFSVGFFGLLTGALPSPLPLPLPSAELEVCLRLTPSSLKKDAEEAERGEVGDSRGVKGDGGP